MDKSLILLVEDNPDDAALALRAMEKGSLDVDVVVARDGVEALDYILGGKSSGDTPARPLPRFILLDLKLPRIDGLEVLRQIREHPRTRLIPVVILTSSDEQSDLVRCFELGANSYVHKPVDFKQFAQAVQQVGSYWLLINRCPPLPGLH